MSDYRAVLNKTFVKQVSEIRVKYLEMLTAAYFEHTNLSPDDVILVEERINNQIHWYFKKRNYE